MKVAVTGASGIQGMSAMIYLLEQGDVEKILATDHYNLARLEKRIKGLGDDRLCMSELDCTNEDASAAAFKGYDVVVNCVHIPGYYLNTTRGALRAGANYIDLGSSGQDREIFELSDEFRKRNSHSNNKHGDSTGSKQRDGCLLHEQDR